jgi:hypothetical protein
MRGNEVFRRGSPVIRRLVLLDASRSRNAAV